MNAKSFQTTDYDDFAALRLRKNKANSNPNAGLRPEARNPKQIRPSLSSLWSPSTTLRTASVANRKCKTKPICGRSNECKLTYKKGLQK